MHLLSRVEMMAQTQRWSVLSGMTFHSHRLRLGCFRKAGDESCEQAIEQKALMQRRSTSEGVAKGGDHLARQAIEGVPSVPMSADMRRVGRCPS